MSTRSSIIPHQKREFELKGIREQDDLFRTLAEKSFAGIYVVQDGLFRFLNDNAASYAGYSRKELTGQKSDCIVHPDDREEVKKKARAMLRNEDHSPHVFRIITKQGQIRWIMETVTAITFEGRPAILGNSMDVTEWKLTEQALQISENRYRTIFETTGTATMVLEEDTSISLINQEFEKAFGYSEEDVIGRSWTEFTFEEDVERMVKYHHLRRVNPNAAPRNYMFRFISKSGELRDIYLTVDIIPGTSTSIASLLDVTANKQAEDALKKRGEELEVKTRELEEMNAALRVLLKRREEDKNELEEKVLSNIQKIIMPHLENLKKCRPDPHIMNNVALLENNLKDIVSPFSHKLSSKYLRLTPKELQVANLIKEGKTTKEIAVFMGVCTGSIDLHRNHIRKKLGLNKKKINLRSYLLSLS